MQPIVSLEVKCSYPLISLHNVSEIPAVFVSKISRFHSSIIDLNYLALHNTRSARIRALYVPKLKNSRVSHQYDFALNEEATNVTNYIGRSHQ